MEASQPPEHAQNDKPKENNGNNGNKSEEVKKIEEAAEAAIKKEAEEKMKQHEAEM